MPLRRCHGARKGDERAIRSGVRFFAPLVWEQALEEALRAALARARDAGEDGADAALADVGPRGPRSLVVPAVVRLLDRRQLEEARRHYITSMN